MTYTRRVTYVGVARHCYMRIAWIAW